MSNFSATLTNYGNKNQIKIYIILRALQGSPFKHPPCCYKRSVAISNPPPAAPSSLKHDCLIHLLILSVYLSQPTQVGTAGVSAANPKRLEEGFPKPHSLLPCVICVFYLFHLLFIIFSNKHAYCIHQSKYQQNSPSPSLKNSSNANQAA